MQVCSIIHVNETVSGFDWDEGNRAKCQKHGVTLGEIKAVFEGRPSIYPDPDHSIREQRLLAIGRTGRGRPMLVAFTLRDFGGRTLIRPISARFMHRKEVERYERR